jgi:hypothetical protein
MEYDKNYISSGIDVFDWDANKLEWNVYYGWI